MIREMIIKNRSYRRFHEEYSIEENVLWELVELARLSGSAKNLQPLKYILIADKKRTGVIFPNLSWAGYLKEWKGPSEGERPSAYIIILGDTEISSSFEFDAGMAAENMLLGATEMGLGGCIIGSANKDRLKKELNIPERYKLLYVIALGKPKETVVLEDLPEDGNIKYWRDSNEVHHVPKRSAEEIIIKI